MSKATHMFPQTQQYLIIFRKSFFRSLAEINVCFLHLRLYNLLRDLHELHIRPWPPFLVFPFSKIAVEPLNSGYIYHREEHQSQTYCRAYQTLVWVFRHHRESNKQANVDLTFHLSQHVDSRKEEHTSELKIVSFHPPQNG